MKAHTCTCTAQHTLHVSSMGDTKGVWYKVNVLPWVKCQGQRLYYFLEPLGSFSWQEMANDFSFHI